MGRQFNSSTRVRRRATDGGAVARERAVALGHCPKEEEGEGHRAGHGPEWPGGPNATWASADDWAEMENRLRI
jgi:hypothetical protein